MFLTHRKIRSHSNTGENVITLYRGMGIVISDVAAISELHIWYEWVGLEKTAQESQWTNYDLCNKEICPTIHFLLRTFSTLQMVQTNLRSITGQERLNGFAMLNIHKEICVTLMKY